MAEDEGPTRLKRSLSERLKRKSQVARGEAVPEMPETSLPPGTVSSAEESDEEAALSDDELLAKYGVDDPEAIEDEDKLDTLLKGQFPDRIRQMALRRMWRLNPLFRFADEMVEYGENYTDAATVIDGMQTAYQVGKGYLQKAFDAVDDDKVDAAAAGAEAKPLADSPDQSRLAAEPSQQDEDDQPSRAEAGDDLAQTDATGDAASDKATIDTATAPDSADETPQLDSPVILNNDGDDVPPPRPRRMTFRRPTDSPAE